MESYKIEAKSLSQINFQLNRAENKDKNIRITRSLGTTIEFLDVLVTNDLGHLKTSVFHKPAAELYVLPYLFEHPSHIHCNTIKGTLLRAILLCSHVEDFDRERLQIELKLLLNGYPLKFVTKQFIRFFEQHDQLIYQSAYKTLLAPLSRRQKQYSELISNDNNNSFQQQQSDRSKITVHFTFQSDPMLQFKHELLRL